MNQIFRLPLLPIFVVYTIGISLGQLNLPFSFQGWSFFLILLGGWTLLLLMKRLLLGSLMTFSIFFLLGIFSIQLYLRPQPSSHISHFTGLERISLEGIIDRPPERSRGRTQLLIRSQQVILSNRRIAVDGLLLIFLQENDPSLRVGDRLRLLCKLHSPHGFHNPGGFSYERHLAFEQVHVIGFLSVEKGIVKLGEGFKNPLLLQMESWRDHIRDFLEREANPVSSGIYKALVLGEQGDIPEDIKEHFIVTGIAHLLAISGDHLGIVALLSFSLLIWILKRSEFLLLTIDVRKWAAALTLPCLLLYTSIAGGGISVIRATIMVITFFLSILFNRERDLLHTLALAAFLILIFSPASLFDVSFQLSFLAVLSILYSVPRILQDLKQKGIFLVPKTSWEGNILKYIFLSLLVSGVAILGTAPFVALHFNRFSLIGFFTNLFMIPWVGFLIVPLSLIASLLSFFFYPFAAVLIHINDWITLILLKVVAFFASIPYASIFLSTPTILEMILFYLLLFSIVHLRKRKKIRYLFVGLCIVFVFDLVFWNLRDSFREDLRLTFIDVGHGDCILIEFPKGNKMLLDGEGLNEDRFDIGKNVIAPFLWKKKIRRIDTLVLTHPDPDHLKGLNFIASQFSIGQFWDNGIQTESEPYLQLNKTLNEKKIRTQSLHEETPPQVINGVEISILNPPQSVRTQRRGKDHLDPNNSSLVMNLRLRNVSVLLTGDIGKEAEERMSRKSLPLHAEILKIPHHGSSSSSSPLFLDRVNPNYAILSVGQRNPGRLPDPEILERYERLGAKIFRTDRHGAITVVTDGDGVKVIPFIKDNP